MPRRTDRYHVGATNPLWHMYRTVSFFKVMWCFTIITIGRFSPSLRFKNSLYRTCLRMKIGDRTALALDGHAGYDVPGTDYDRLQYDHRL